MSEQQVSGHHLVHPIGVTYACLNHAQAVEGTCCSVYVKLESGHRLAPTCLFAEPVCNLEVFSIIGGNYVKTLGGHSHASSQSRRLQPG